MDRRSLAQEAIAAARNRGMAMPRLRTRLHDDKQEAARLRQLEEEELSRAERVTAVADKTRAAWRRVRKQHALLEKLCRGARATARVDSAQARWQQTAASPLWQRHSYGSDVESAMAFGPGAGGDALAALAMQADSPRRRSLQATADAQANVDLHAAADARVSRSSAANATWSPGDRLDHHKRHNNHDRELGRYEDEVAAAPPVAATNEKERKQAGNTGQCNDASADGTKSKGQGKGKGKGKGKGRRTRNSISDGADTTLNRRLAAAAARAPPTLDRCNGRVRCGTAFCHAGIAAAPVVARRWGTTWLGIAAKSGKRAQGCEEPPNAEQSKQGEGEGLDKIQALTRLESPSLSPSPSPSPTPSPSPPPPPLGTHIIVRLRAVEMSYSWLRRPVDSLADDYTLLAHYSRRAIAAPRRSARCSCCVVHDNGRAVITLDSDAAPIATQPRGRQRRCWRREGVDADVPTNCLLPRAGRATAQQTQDSVAKRQLVLRWRTQFRGQRRTGQQSGPVGTFNSAQARLPAAQQTRRGTRPAQAICIASLLRTGITKHGRGGSLFREHAAQSKAGLAFLSWQHVYHSGRVKHGRRRRMAPVADTSTSTNREAQRASCRHELYLMVHVPLAQHIADIEAGRAADPAGVAREDSSAAMPSPAAHAAQRHSRGAAARRRAARGHPCFRRPAHGCNQPTRGWQQHRKYALNPPAPVLLRRRSVMSSGSQQHSAHPRLHLTRGHPRSHSPEQRVRP